MGWLDAQVSLITGAGSGLGRALVERFLKEGTKGIGVLEYDAAKAQKLRDDFGDKIVVTLGDVGQIEDNQKAVAATVAAFGQLDTFIGNAGVFDYFQSLKDFPAEQIGPAFDELYSVNVKGYLLGAKAALEELERTRGSIIFTLSNAAFYPSGGGAIYTSSKHAVVGLVKQLGHELAPEIRVNGVAPGGMASDLGGLKATGTKDQKLKELPDFDQMMIQLTPLQIATKPKDYCGPYVLLASKENSGPMSGSIINTDGGLGIMGFNLGG